MDDFKEFQGKSLDEAIRAACSYFDAQREKLEIDIIQDAKNGIFGLVGARKAIVRARRAQLKPRVGSLLARDAQPASAPKAKAEDASRAPKPRQGQAPRPPRGNREPKPPFEEDDSIGNRILPPVEEDDSIGNRILPEETDIDDSIGNRVDEPRAPRRPRRNDGPRIPYEGNEDAFRPRRPRPERRANQDRPDRPERQERPERQDRQDRPRTPRPPYEPRQERRPVEAPAEQDVLRDSSLEFDQDEALNEGLPSKPFSELDQEKLTAVSQEVAFKIVSSILGETPVEVKIMENRVDIHVDCGDDSGLLIGREGQTLAALQYLTSRIVSRRMEAPVRVQFDVGDYRERQDDRLRELALALAERVRATGRPCSTRPMSSYHRRLVHMALQDSPDVQTRSSGEGPLKRVTILPILPDGIELAANSQNLTAQVVVKGMESVTFEYDKNAVELNGVPDDVKVTISDVTIKLVVTGRESIISALKEDDFHFSVDISDLEPGTHKVSLDCKYDKSISEVDYTPQEIEVNIEG